MKFDFSNTRIFIKPGATDLRKAATGLSYIVRDEMNLKVLDDSVFLFCNKSRKLLKLLCWDRTGFWLAQKRLEHERWPWPKTSEEAQEISQENILLLLKGIDFWRALPRKKLVLDIEETEKHCACGHELVRIGEDTSEQLIHIPEQIYVLQKTIRPKYACRNCEGFGDEDKAAVRQMPAPKRIIEKSIASPTLLASVISNKFELALPYYRQEKAYEHSLIDISRQDMSNWQEALYKKCRPLEPLIVKLIKIGNVLHLDETTVQVLSYEGGKEIVNGKPRSKSYMWLASGGPKGKPAVVFRYNKNRSGMNALEFINGFSGYLMTDGYEGYESALDEHNKLFPKEKIRHCSCLAHARRKFSDASKVSKSKSPEEAIKMIRDIYRRDNKIRETVKNDEKTVRLRKEELTPLFEEFHSWLKEKERLS